MVKCSTEPRRERAEPVTIGSMIVRMFADIASETCQIRAEGQNDMR